MLLPLRSLSLGVLSCLAFVSVAQAQDLAPLQDRVERLEQSILDLRRFVHQGKGAAKSDTGGTAAPQPARLASEDAVGANAKIAALEEEVRALTNRVEEMNFLVKRMDSRMNKLVEDVDFRLTAIERNMASGGATGTGAPATAATGPTTGAPVPSGGEQSLGTVSQEALDRVPGGTTSAPPATTGGPVKSASTVAPVRAATLGEVPQGALSGAPEERYKAAFGLLRAKRFGEAETAFVQFIADNPKHELAGNAQYWLGETYYVQQDYQRAASAFLDGYKKYRSSSKAPDNLLKLGMTLALLDQKPDACVVFDELKDRFPNASRSITRRAVNERKKAGCA